MEGDRVPAFVGQEDLVVQSLSVERRKKGMLTTPRIVNPRSARKDGLNFVRGMMWRARQMERKRSGRGSKE
jgi:hypothetical protein